MWSKKHSIFLFFLFLLFSTNVFSLNIIERTEPALWNDTTLVAIIWNDGTGDDEMGWTVSTGELGSGEKDFLLESLKPLKSENIKEFYGMHPKWDTLTLEGLKKEFNGKLPHVIAYINAGYTWAQHLSFPKPKDPYSLIYEAANEGVGIVAIGDDAATDAKTIFPLTGPDGIGDPVQYDYPTNGSIPHMASAVDWLGFEPYNGLWIWMDTNIDEALPDGGLLWSLDDLDTLFFKNVYDRGQADADIWDVDISKLDDYSFIGYQQGEYTAIQWGANGGSSKFIGNTPQYEAWPHSSTGYSADGQGYEYTALAALQQGNHRIAMIGYQPSYIDDQDASGQILYNSIFWASKAHAKEKISTPVPDPLSGSTHDVSEITLSVLSPKNTSLYKIYYTIDGSTPTKSSLLYDGTAIKIPADTKSDFTLKAIAFSEDSENWIDSDMLTVTYEYTIAKISTPVADPKSGNTQTVKDITLSVSNPTDKSLYKIIYTFDPEDSLVLKGTEYDGNPFDLPDKITKDVILYAKAIPIGTDEWIESNVMKVVYEYVGGPLIDSALFLPGKLSDLKTSEREDDTLIVWFNTVIKPINTSSPFLFKDSSGADYLFTINQSEIDYDSLKVSFIVNGVIDKSAAYLPIDNRDSISIDHSANITDEKGIVQDGSNNFFVPLRVGPIPFELTINSGWMDIPSDLKEIKDIKTGALIVADLEAVIPDEKLEAIEASISVYDMLGNEVIKTDNLQNSNSGSIYGEFKKINGRKQLVIIWDGLNKKGRRVGSAMYLAKLTLIDHEGEKSETTFTIGVPGKE